MEEFTDITEIIRKSPAVDPPVDFTYRMMGRIAGMEPVQPSVYKDFLMKPRQFSIHPLTAIKDGATREECFFYFILTGFAHLILASVLFLGIRDIYGNITGSTWLMIQPFVVLFLAVWFFIFGFLLLRWRIAGLTAARIAIFIYLEIIIINGVMPLIKIWKSVLPASLLGVDCKLHDYWRLPCINAAKDLRSLCIERQAVKKEMTMKDSELIRKCRDPLRGVRGFTLIEIIAVLIVIGVLAVVAINRALSSADTGKNTQVSIIKEHIRYAQSVAMKRGESWGIKCDGTYYWLFRNTPATPVILPGENNAQVTLSDKNVSMAMNPTAVFFDASGRPYTAYTDATTNTPVSAGNTLSITIDSIPASGAVTFYITPETGFIL